MSKKIITGGLLAIFILIVGFVAIYFCWPDKTILLVSHVCRKSKIIPNPVKNFLNSKIWNIHYDKKRGFSFRYPLSWQNQPNGFPAYYTAEPEPAGISLIIEDVKHCTNSRTYAEQILFETYGKFDTKPLPNPELDGFMVKGTHLDDLTLGDEAYIFHCPYLIRIGFNPINVEDADKVFEKIILSVKTWKPSD